MYLPCCQLLDVRYLFGEHQICTIIFGESIDTFPVKMVRHDAVVHVCSTSKSRAYTSLEPSLLTELHHAITQDIL